MNRCIAKPPKPQAPDFKAAATLAESTETSITCPFHTAWPESGDYYVAKLGTFAVALYRRRGADTAAWVAYTEEQAQGQSHEPARWVERQVEETGMPVALRASTLLMHVEAIRAGTGRGVIPCYIGDGHPLLERLTAPIPELAATYWMIVHRDLRRAPCVRAVIDWMKVLFAQQRDAIAGVVV